MNICIVTGMYPNKFSSSDFVFVKKLVDEFARQGHSCCVVSPFNFLHYRGFEKVCSKYKVDNNVVTVFRPPYLSLGNHKQFASIVRISQNHALNKSFRMMECSGFQPDVIYCHFWNSGIEAYSFAKKNNYPLFVATGESDDWMECMNRPPQEVLDYIKGVICVSSSNKTIAERRGFCSKEIDCVFPNSINNLLFRSLDREMCRNKLNIPQDKFIVSYVGWFDERKGAQRVSTAISEIEIKDIYSLFIGSGNDIPTCPNILFLGKVSHEELPTYLNASDAFVLPTQHEGCCNAVIEAMACGLPIISSNLPFNWDVLDETNSIMVDPNNIEEIKTAIIALRDNIELRESLSRGALLKAQQLTIDKRARNIIRFIQGKLS